MGLFLASQGDLELQSLGPVGLVGCGCPSSPLAMVEDLQNQEEASALLIGRVVWWQVKGRGSQDTQRQLQG
jgi:hypothetical protein